MESQRFDDLTRAVATGISRRRFAAGMLGALAAGLLDARPGRAARGKTAICHATGSPRRPYEKKVVDDRVVQSHLAHGDFLFTDCCVDADCAGAFETCGGGGTAGACGCTPTSCAAEGANCGEIRDGCGASLSCGGCTAPQTCGGGGNSNVCGCTPDNVAACVGRSCGDVVNNCGDTISCGTCTEANRTCCGGTCKLIPGAPCSANGECCSGVCVDELCQAGCSAENGSCDDDTDCCPGTNCTGSSSGVSICCSSGNACGSSCCATGDEVCDAGDACCSRPDVSETCAGKCDQVLDACDQLVECGSCPEPQVCGGDGIPNVCGCAPPSCAGMCGTVKNACDVSVDCGECAEGACTVENTCCPPSQVCEGANLHVCCTVGADCLCEEVVSGSGDTISICRCEFPGCRDCPENGQVCCAVCDTGSTACSYSCTEPEGCSCDVCGEVSPYGVGLVGRG